MLCENCDDVIVCSMLVVNVLTAFVTLALLIHAVACVWFYVSCTRHECANRDMRSVILDHSSRYTIRLSIQSINQSINLFVQKCNTHLTGHQGRMQPPLTGAHKNKVSKSNK